MTPDEYRTIRVKGWGFWITWGRLAFVVICCALVPALVTGELLLADKVDRSDQVDAFRKGCQRNVGTARDNAEAWAAHRAYLGTVLGASSVKNDVKKAALHALETYDRVVPRLESRVIDCEQAFPQSGKPRIVRVK